jgi:hypothetical protein
MHYLLNANVRVTTFVLGMKIKKKKKDKQRRTCYIQRADK